jgi:hypothetical protein
MCCNDKRTLARAHTEQQQLQVKNVLQTVVVVVVGVVGA